MLSSVTAAGSYPFVLGLMAGLRCCASHGRIISIKGLAVNSGSPWILQAPNLKRHCPLGGEKRGGCVMILLIMAVIDMT